MNIEYEVRKLEVNKELIIQKLESLGAIKKFASMQKRYVYDTIPVKENKWIRLRSSNNKVTLAIKEVCSEQIDGTKEIEIVVDDFQKTNEVLEELGFTHRSYQENERIQYLLDEVEIDIDTWPLIPTYVELEGKEENIYKVAEKLELKKEELTSLDVEGIYNKIYNIDVMKIKKIKFEQ